MHTPPRPRRLVAASLALLAIAACSSAETTATRTTEEAPPARAGAVPSPRRLPRGAAPVLHASALRTPPRSDRATAPSQQLLYFGGRVISNVNVVAVNWGPNVSTTISSQIGAFYTAITNSAYFDWLSEYDTTGVRAVDGALGTSQRIGRGTFAGSVTIEPTNDSKTISDTEIEAEIAAQLAAGHLPAPVTDAAGNVDSLYMFDFPADMTITLWNAGAIATGCADFGAYHSTVRVGTQSIPYGVHPDCGGAFTDVTLAHSHEMIEAVTDTEVGLVDPDLTPGETRPSAWYSFIGGVDNGEAADICEGGAGATVAGYDVATIWSNSQGACIATAPTIICDGSTPAITGCRACTAADDGVACNGERAVCETDATNAKFGECVVCAQSSTCPAAEPTCKKSSDSTDDTCVTTASCTSGSCAGTTPICDTGTHACRPCEDGDCSGATPACEKLPGNVNFGKCVACTESLTTACTGATPACDTFTNECVACMFNSDCGASSPVCTFPAHTCIACASSSDCAPGGGVCATGATDPDKGHCVQCQSTADCESPATCANDTCTPGASSADGGADAATGGDSGLAGGDAGIDSGTTGEDGGPDSGISQPDAGADSGTPEPDAGSDSGAVTVDSGAPQDAGQNDSDAGMDAAPPPRDSGAAALDATSPVVDSGAPSGRDASEVADSATPVAPDDGGETTEAGTSDDGGSGAGSAANGCSCKTAPGAASSNDAAMAVLVVGLAAMTGRRRRRHENAKR